MSDESMAYYLNMIRINAIEQNLHVIAEWAERAEELRRKDLADENQLIHRLLRDYDRRRSTRWGRFLLWLLRKTT